MSLTDQRRLLLFCLVSLSITVTKVFNFKFWNYVDLVIIVNFYKGEPEAPIVYEYDDDGNTLEGFVVEGDMVTPDDEDDGRFGSAPITDRDRSGKLLLCPNESSIYL